MRCEMLLKKLPEQCCKSIIPSNAMLVTPDLEAMPEAIVAKSIGVVALSAAFKNSGEKRASNIILLCLLFIA